MIIQILT